MALPNIEDCTCRCHEPSGVATYAHSGECCAGASLAWGGWGIDNDDAVAKNDSVAYGNDQDD